MNSITRLRAKTKKTTNITGHHKHGFIAALLAAVLTAFLSPLIHDCNAYVEKLAKQYFVDVCHWVTTQEQIKKYDEFVERHFDQHKDVARGTVHVAVQVVKSIGERVADDLGTATPGRLIAPPK